MQPKKNHSQEYISHKFFHIFSYLHTNNRKVAALNLWVNGLRIFENATVIKEFETFSTIPCGKHKCPPVETVMPFILDNIMDKTRIITCFENFMKGVLVLEGYVVHRISRKNSTLRNHQNSRPIKIEEVFTDQSFVNFDPLKIEEHETTDQTLGFNTLLLSKYQDIIRLPQNILDTVKGMNIERNRLHFLQTIDFSIGKPVIENLQNLINFVMTVMVPQILHLNKNMIGIKMRQFGEENFET